MSVIDFTDYKKNLTGNTPKKITFRGAVYFGNTNTPSSLNFTFTIADGDVAGAIEAAKEFGGIPYTTADGKTIFLPWPPAAIEIEDV